VHRFHRRGAQRAVAHRQELAPAGRPKRHSRDGTSQVAGDGPMRPTAGARREAHDQQGALYGMIQFCAVPPISPDRRRRVRHPEHIYRQGRARDEAHGGV